MKNFYEKEFYNNAENYKILLFGKKDNCKFYYMQPKTSFHAVLPAIIKINVYGVIENILVAPQSVCKKLIPA